MMKFNILITGGLYNSQAAYAGLQFCRAALDAGHAIEQVFFYQDGVSIANRFSTPLADEFDGHHQWIELAQRHSFPVMVCVSAAERRGILNSATAIEGDLESSDLSTVFHVAGLGALHEASLNSNRTITFN
jgi:tRNA 2-thiouridine synthesizing protein D